MVAETNIEGKTVYKCEKCGWLYKDKNIADKCESYCIKHNACNIIYQKYAIKLNKSVNLQLQAT